VKRSTVSGGPYTTVGSTGGTSFTNTGLANGTTYFYVVTAVNASGESGNSNQVSATPQSVAPAPPTQLTATGTSPDGSPCTGYSPPRPESRVTASTAGRIPARTLRTPSTPSRRTPCIRTTV
jgi:hypothetical protein